MWALQLIANIKHRNPSNFPSQPFPMYNQPFHTSTRVGRNNPLLVSASTMHHHRSNTTVQPLAVDTGRCRALRNKNRQYTTHLCHLRHQKIWTVFSTTDRSIFLKGPWIYSTHSVSVTQITQTPALISRVFSSRKYAKLLPILSSLIVWNISVNKFQYWK